MRALAAWLTARPWNSVLGLSVTLLMPFAQILSGTVMVLLVLAAGLQQALVAALGSAVMLVALFLAFGNPLPPLVASALAAWAPVALLAVLLTRTRSLTLTLQLSVILAVVATLVINAALGDPVSYWSAWIDEMAAWFEARDLEQQATALRSQRDVLAAQMTMILVASSWSIAALVLVMGNALARLVPERATALGRFGDLQFGKVLALVMAVASLGALLVDVGWLDNVAFVLFAVFWLQGLAIVHWLHDNGPLPIGLVVAVYVLLPFLNALLVAGLAVLGYTDAWFDYRSRIHAARSGK